MIFRLAFKELRTLLRLDSRASHRRQLLLAFVILALGFIGPLLATSLQSSTREFLKGKSRESLSADLALSAFRPLTEAEIKTAQEHLGSTIQVNEIEFVSMVSSARLDAGASVASGTSAVAEASDATGASTESRSGAANSALVEIHALGEGMPIYGAFRLRAQSDSVAESTSSAPASTPAKMEKRFAAELNQSQVAWVYPEVLVQLGVRVGDLLQIGQAQFKIVGEVLDGPGSLRMGFGLAPRIYIGHRFVGETALDQAGSQLTYRSYFRLAEGIDPEIAASSIKAVLSSPDIFLRTPEDSVQGLDRFLKFFARYISILTLLIFVLAWMSAFYILQVFISDQLRNAAVMILLGAKRRVACGVYVVQMGLVSLLALFTALAVVSAILYMAQSFLRGPLVEGLHLALHAQDIVTFAGLALLSSLGFQWPLLLKILSLRPQVLLGENSFAASKSHVGWRTRLRTVAAEYSPILAVFFFLSSWLLSSWIQGLWFFVALVAISTLGWAAGRGLFVALGKLVYVCPGSLRMAVINLGRGRFGTTLCFLTLIFVALILNLVPHLLKSVTTELSPLGRNNLPDFFLFNIPESEVSGLEQFAQTHQLEVKYLSPLILSRLEKVNGQKPEEERFSKFPVRVSYRAEVASSETVIEGAEIEGPFDPGQQTHPWVSIESGFAERSGFRIGDILEFDVQGMPVTGQIRNLRRVKWTDFHPNFFVEFQTGVLEDAPKTYLANLHLPVGLPVGLSEGLPAGLSGDLSKELPLGLSQASGRQAKADLQFALVRQFPNISIIDVGQTIQRIVGLVDGMIGPIRSIAWLAVTMGFLILIAIIRHNLSLRRDEMEILKILGADSGRIRGLIVLEYGLMAVLSVFLGAGVAILIALLVADRFFDIQGQIDWVALGLSSSIAILIVTLLARHFIGRLLSSAKFRLVSEAP